MTRPLPYWPELMDADLAGAFLGISRASFLATHAPTIPACYPTSDRHWHIDDLRGIAKRLRAESLAGEHAGEEALRRARARRAQRGQKHRCADEGELRREGDAA